jgi:ATP-dependent RNA helicase DeaD
VPSIVDLRARRLEKTRLTVRQVVEKGKLESFRTVIESLGEEFDLIDVAAAALKIAHEASGNRGEEEEEIQAVQLPRESKSARKQDKRADFRPAPAKTAKGKAGEKGRMVRVRLAFGRKAGVRPADIVGAIANEAGIPGRDIGNIEIGNGFSLVEIPESSADAVVEAMTGVKIRGQRVNVRLERDVPVTRRKR